LLGPTQYPQLRNLYYLYQRMGSRNKMFTGQGHTLTGTQTHVEPTDQHNAKNGSSSTTTSQFMFSNTSNVTATDSEFNNVGGSQSNIYGTPPPAHRGRTVSSTVASDLPSNVPGQSMFSGAHGVRANNVQFSNVAGHQSNTHYDYPQINGPSSNSYSEIQSGRTSYGIRPTQTASHNGLFNPSGQSTRGQLSNVRGDQHNTYYDPQANGPSTSSPYGGQHMRTVDDIRPTQTAAPSNPTSQAMFSNARGIVLTNSHLSNVGGSQTNQYYNAEAPPRNG